LSKRPKSQAAAGATAPRFAVRGTVFGADGKPVARREVRAFARTLRAESPIGQAVTDSAGEFDIGYGATEGSDSADRGPDLIVRAFDKQGGEIAASPIIFNAKRSEVVDLHVREERLERSASEVERLLAALEPALQGESLHSLTRGEIEYLAGSTGQSVEQVALLVDATVLAGDGLPPKKIAAAASRSGDKDGGKARKAPAGIPAEVFYGWFRQGLPRAADALWQRPADELLGALRASISENIVLNTLAKKSREIAEAIKARRVEHVLLPGEPEHAGTLGDLLATMPRPLSGTKRQVVAAALHDGAVNGGDLIKRLKQANFDAREIADVQVTKALGDLTDGNTLLVQELQGLRPARDDSSLRFLASRTPLQWMELVDTHGVRGTTPLEPAAYAELLEQRVDDEHPTAVFAARVLDNVLELKDPAFRDAASFLAANPEVELTRGNARAVVARAGRRGDDGKEDQLVDSLERIQRTRKLTRSWREAGTLLDNDMHSSLDIVRNDPATFAAIVAKNIPPERAREIYDGAKSVHDTTVALLGNIVTAWLPGSFAVLDTTTSTPVNHPGLRDYPNLRKLFGSLDSCECGHCQSVLGPAAYLVDLLRFLDPPLGAPGGSPLHALLARRPDIAELELTCANTDTEIPYVDLVLEILENAVGLPLDVPAPYGFDPDVDFLAAPLAANIARALRRVLASSATTIGPRLQVAKATTQLLLGTFSDWIVGDGSRTWVLRNWPQSLTLKFSAPETKILGRRVQVASYPATIALLDQSLLPDASWLIPPGGPREANLPLKGTPTVTVLNTGRQWKVEFTRAVRVHIVMGGQMGAVIVRNVDGQQLAAVQTTAGVLQALAAALSNGRLAEPVTSTLPSGLPPGMQYAITRVGQDWEIAATGIATLQHFEERMAIVSLTYQNSGSSEDLKASPENRNPEAYEKIGAALFPWRLPFDPWLDEVRAFLDRRGVPRRQLMEEANPDRRLLDDVTGDAIARETLQLSEAEAEIIAPTTAQDGWQYWGLGETDTVIDLSDDTMVSGSWIALLKRVSILLQRSGLSYGELLNVLQTRFVRAITPDLSLSGEGCDVSRLTLPKLKADHLDRIHRLTRLARKLDWTPFEVDAAIAAATNGAMTLTPATLRGLSHIQRLHELFGLPVGTIASWWGTLITERRTDYTSARHAPTPSIYDTLFLRRAGENPSDPDFALDNPPPATKTLLGKSPRIAAALGIRAAELAPFIAAVATGNPAMLKLSNLVALYRHRSVARALGISIPDYLRALALSDTDPFDSPGALVAFVEAVQAVVDGRFGFTLEEIDYLLRYTVDGAPTPLLPSAWVELTLAELREVLQAVRRDATATSESPADHLGKMLARLGWYPALVDEAVALITSQAQFEAALPSGGTAPTVAIPTALADFLSYDATTRRLTLDGTLDQTEWTSVSTANTANGAAVASAIAALKSDAEAFVATFGDRQHRLQALALPTHRVAYTTTALPAIPADLRTRLYYDAPAKQIVLVGWVTADEERKLKDVLPAAIVQALKAASNAYVEGDLLNAFLTENDLRVLFLHGQSPEARVATVLARLVPWLSREAAIERLSASIGIEARITRDLLLRQLDRSLVLDALLASAFVASDSRIAPTAGAFPEQRVALGKLHKAALVAVRVALRGEELPWLPAAQQGAGSPVTFATIALDDLPIASGDTPAAIADFTTLLDLFQLRDASMLGTPLVSQVLASVDAADKAGLHAAIATRLQLSAADVAEIADNRLGLTWPALYLEPTRLVSLARLLRTIRTLGVSPADALSLAVSAPGPSEAILARHILRAHTTAESWPDQLKPVEDVLRERRRAALVDFLIQRDGLRDATELYDRYLVDVEMATCKVSTRILLAISAVQLFTQRCLMNLEDGVSPAAIDSDRWRWMKNYRVWEANRKVFLYPENWIEPALRDDKSEIFTELEGQLLQQDLDKDRAEEILKGYLKQLEDISRLTIVGTYVERLFRPNSSPSGMAVHFVGRTQNRPSHFFHRRWILSPTVNRWTPWERVPLDGVKTDHVLPFVLRGDVYVAWPEITQLPAQADTQDPGAPGPKWQLQMSWMRKSARGWSDRYLSVDTIEHPWVVGKNDNQSFSFRIRETSLDSTDIECYGVAREGALTYAAPSTDDIAPTRTMFPIPSNAPWAKIGFTGTVYAAYQNNTVFLPMQGATVRAALVFTGGSEDDRYWGPRDRQWDLDSNDLKLYGNHDEASGASSGNGYFSLLLTLVALHPDRAFFRPKLLNCVPEFRLEVKLPDGRTQTKSFTFFDPQSATKTTYSDERFQQNFIFQMQGVAPGAEVDRPVSMKPIRLFRLLAAEDAEVLPLSAPALPVPTGMLSYGSGFRAESASQNSPLTVPNSTGVAIWQGVAPRYSVLPNAPASYQGADVLVYADAAATYVIRREDADIDSTGASDKFQVLLHGHPRAADLRRLLTLRGVPEVYGLAQQEWKDWTEFAGHTAGAAFDGASSLTQPAIRFEPDEARSPYASYNTELFFHVPLLIATYLSENQRFADAQEWFHLIFDPTTNDPTTGNQRYWRYLPFRTHSQTNPIDELLTMLADPGVVDTDKRKIAVRAQIDAWLENPFRPHAVARLRPRAYEFAVIFKYLDNLLAWGDRLFRQSTTESINEATQLYILVAKLLGPRPHQIPRRAQPSPLTYRRAGNWSDFSNAWVEVESSLPVEPRLPIRFGRGRLNELQQITSIGMPYFCVPGNDKLLEYWDTLERRLFDIRHCRNIDGVEQQVPLFQPPIDPALLVRAAAEGLDIDVILADGNAPRPHYRFSVLAQKASELCGEVRALGGAILSALEKKDAEELSLLRSGLELELLDLVGDVRRRQIDEAKANVDALRQSEQTAVARYRQYQRLLGKSNAIVSDDPGADVEQMSLVHTGADDSTGGLAGLGTTKAEQDQMGWSEAALAYGITAGVHSTLASIFFAIPQTQAGTPFFSAQFGGLNLGNVLNAGSAFWGTFERNASYQAGRAGTIAGYQRRQDEWVFQSRLALREVQQVRKQTIAAQIRQAIAEQELKNHEKQIRNARAVDDFMRRKYTNAELYQWMAGQLAGVYFQSYQLALDVAKRAERTFRHELGLRDSSFIKSAYWDTRKKGLMAGERLYHDLKRLEVAYLEQNKREYEITKHVSLQQLDPAALIALRETGRCEIDIPEALFDLDFAGHYLRRIRTVSMTIPCVTGPYASVPCTLTLLKSEMRVSNAPGRAYGRDTSTGEDDARFADLFGPIQSIVTSGAQNDSGMFEQNMRDERYLPFEGAGAISRWRIELPMTFSAFDYETITDVVLHLRFTARDGGAALRSKAEAELQGALNAIVSLSSEGEGMSRLFSLRHEFPTEWHRLLTNTAGPGAGAQEIVIDKMRFPFLVGGRKIKITSARVFAVPDAEVKTPVFPSLSITPPGENTAVAFVEGTPLGRVLSSTFEDEIVVSAKAADARWKFEIPIGDLASFRKDVDDVVVLFNYRIE
jgi:hypothetical protein